MAALHAVRIGYRPPHELFDVADGRLAVAVRRVEAAGIDRICVGDHVSFRGGRGFDGIVNATAAAMLSSNVVVQTAVYLLPLRHPVPVARQVASLASLAPGRFVFGVGVGGDDRAEVALCGVDPATRGRRMDEALAIVRALLAGQEVSADGEFFPVREARIRPAPSQVVPIIVGGRSGAAVRRAGRLGDGWLGVWVSPDRFRDVAGAVEAEAADAGRTGVTWQHGVQAWCGFAPTRDQARSRVAAAMEELYQLPFERFERYVPWGTPEDVASALEPYVAAGCGDFNLVPVAPSVEESIEGVAAVRELLRGAQ